MKDIPIPTAKTARALPTPQVKQAVIQQAVDLKPAGATVSISTVSDNPFETQRPVRVVTQASGGMTAAAPPLRYSKKLHHAFLPGLGESNTSEVSEDRSILDRASAILTSATDTALTREERKRAEQEARIAEARAREAAARSGGTAVRRGIMDSSVNLFGMRVNVPLLLAGGGLLTFALLRRKKGKKGKK